MISNKKIGIALSGGGFRASAFHLGVLKGLAEKKLLQNISYISSVSGGSLAIGLVFALSKNKWPSNEEYLKILPIAERYLTKIGLAEPALYKLLLPKNWRYIFSRANIISKTLQENWCITSTLAELPNYPLWAINATTNESGKSWRFSKEKMGDYIIGYVLKPDLLISDAMAASAAFPGLIGRFSLASHTYQWYEYAKKDWSSKELIKKDNFEYQKLYLSDGGVYDNLGTEVLFAEFGKKLRDEIDFVIVSDAGKIIETKKSPKLFRIVSRTIRLIDIAMDQIRSLRVRFFQRFINENRLSGLYIDIVDKKSFLNNINPKNIKTSLFCLKLDEYNALIESGETSLIERIKILESTND